jgi:hypothetical protein
VQKEFAERLAVLSARLVASPDWSLPSAQGDIRRIVALCWPHIDRYSRSKFIAYLDDDWLFHPPENIDPADIADLELTAILENWPDVLPGLQGVDLKFAQDVDKRRRWRKWKPSEKQIQWIKALWASRPEVEGDVDLELTE